MSLPKDPPLGLLMSMALRQDHGLGCPGYYDNHTQRVKNTVIQMSQLYEEASGNGFWSEEKNGSYENLYRLNTAE